jgi:phosphopantothenoylcysteine decarboxylase/phosphopantothenate--cysteine ligase
MATITVRNLDGKTKQALRERAARNGHSMEEEARLLLHAGAISTVEYQTSSDSLDILKTMDEASKVSIDPNYPARGKTVLLIICGGIAAYKSLDLIRRLKERGVNVRVVMTQAAGEFVTPLSVGALSHSKVYNELFSREDEQDIGHIRLAREADLIVVAPATANIMAKISHGIVDDLASAVLLASKCKVLVAPAMNPAMWTNPATQRNADTLEGDGFRIIGPNSGEMAEQSEAGRGRMAEPMEIVSEIGRILDTRAKPLSGLKVIVTAGPTHEPIDPVRYIANRSSGKQGYAIAAALSAAGAQVNLVSGPVNLNEPEGLNCIRVESAEEMFQAVKSILPADIAIMVAAVADWRVINSADEKIKKKPGSKNPISLKLAENPDILKFVGHLDQRPELVIGFAAETQDVIKNAKAKLKRKGADWIVANDVSPETGIMGGDSNTVKILSNDGVEQWPVLAKDQVAQRLVEKIISHFEATIIDV